MKRVGKQRGGEHSAEPSRAMTWSLTLPLAISAAMLLVGGCEKAPALSDEGQVVWPAAHERVVAKTDSPIPDVPMPVGFVPVASKSSSYVAVKVRVVDHVYQGVASVEAIANLYERDLPLHDWEVIEAKSTPTGAKVRAVKGREHVQIDIARKKNLAEITVRIRERAKYHRGLGAGIGIS